MRRRLFVVVLLAALVGCNVPPEAWKAKEAQGDLLLSCSGIPVEFPFGPALGNGYWATVMGGNSSYVAGVYNGRSFVTPSHRAALPSPFFGVSIENSTLECEALDLRRGMFMQLFRVQKSLVQLSHWMQRDIGGLAVSSFLLLAGQKDLVLRIRDSRLGVDLFPDFAWRASGDGVHLGTTTTSETPSSPLSTVALLRASYPRSGISLCADVPRLFLSVVANSSWAALALNRSAAQEPLLERHEAAWGRLWRSGISFPSGALDLGKSVNASLYAILSQVRASAPYASTSPGGLATQAYNGHVFWDWETWMFPAMLLLHPGEATNGLIYRLDRLAEAQAKASSLGFSGALFPWESAATGVDCVPDPSRNPEARYEQHISGDVSLAFRQHHLATGDTRFLARAYPLIAQVATFWSGRLADGHIARVMTPDESARVVDDSAYTNAVASLSLKWAVEASRLLNVSFPAEWLTQQRVFIPVRDGLTLEHAEYAGEMINQDDVGLLYWPLEFYPIDFARAKRDLLYYSNKTRRNGYFTGNSAYSVAMMRAGLTAEALQWWATSFLHIRRPWRVFNEKITGGHAHFITGAGGFLQNVIYGFAGISVQRDRLRVAPQLICEGCVGLKIRNLHYLGGTFSLEFESHQQSVVINGGSSDVCVNGDAIVVPPGSNITVANPFNIVKC